MQNAHNFEKTLNAANEFREFAYARRAVRFEAQPIHGIFATYTSVAFDHHAAICLLLRNENATSAFALMRPLVDTCYRAAWLITEGENEAWVQKVLSDDKHAFPPFEQMEEALGRLGHPRMGNGMWKILCSFTHTGAEQLLSQINPEGQIQSNFTDGEKIDSLQCSSLQCI